ncbi:alpha-glucan family phosphorylase [Acetohalobium arabaticum]|uniref:glycogen phosphorylase n=1 Tax=Acetohalobium arabaticum (strain ATCC 49924 / DSM 5501 / Z-7288) TaxID=574087 RepID=D9QQ37_ACEAZ|nr:alpha-glucan family phosphorylase [Acetohalobium arabaticum]ADL12628.1 alpha-glucan phosphorylase [Acetohalobium arabaticum DSM 5501]
MQNKPNIAYFCMEYGLDEELPIYSGGLGVLAGDYLKAAADLDLPVIGLGILWEQDYTQQYIGEDGRPYDTFPTFDFDFLTDTGITVTVNIEGEEVDCKVRLVDKYDNAPLYLLDTNFPESEHGWITSKLYGGDDKDRLAQEMVLGIGGVRALRKLDIDVDKYHFNEGHAVLAGVELIREKMEAGMSFDEAKEATREEIVFTTHTPVRAGNEIHEHRLLQHMKAYNSLNYKQMKEIGDNPFNMTVAGLRLSSITNGVSDLHQETTKEMWKDVDDKAPIIGITNGVHAKTWQDERIKNAYEAGEDLWQPHYELKQELVDYVKEVDGANLNPDSLIIGFARRTAPYKRSELIFRDADAIDPLLREGKIQLVFSGKAHPNDDTGKDIVQNLVQMEQKYTDSVVFLENYDMDIARKMVRGSDVWLNNPRRPLEASGTSGMKAAMNGVLNLSVVDGWLAEGPEHGVSGWLIDEVLHEEYNHLSEDEQDLRALHQIIYDEVIPTYYENHEEWKKMMQASIDMSHEQFSAQRMVKEYYDRLYNITSKERDKDFEAIEVITESIEEVHFPQHEM